MKTMSKLFALLLSLSALGFLTGCDEGPMEEAGENIDEAFEESGEAIDDAADEIDEEF